jgi:hypothetical protein
MDYQDAFTRLATEARRRIGKMTPKELAKKKLPPIMTEVREEDEFLNGHISGAKHILRGLLEQRIGQVALDLPMEWRPNPAFVAKVQRELFPELPLSGESLLTVLEWIQQNTYHRQNGNAGFVSHGSRVFRLIE